MQINREKSYKISLILNVILALAVAVLVLNKMGILTRANLNMPVRPDNEYHEFYEAMLSTFKMNDRDTDIVFAGDSITAGGLFYDFFPSTNLLNRGIGGDTTEGLYNRIGEILSHHPKKIFIMIGINDISNVSRDKSMENYKNIIATIKKEAPGCEIYVQSVLPTKKGKLSVKSGINNNNIEQFNAALVDLCREEKVNYIDLYSLFFIDGHVDEDLLRSDGVHLNEKGYKMWIDAIENKVIY